jgi:hypothetical protein
MALIGCGFVVNGCAANAGTESDTRQQASALDVQHIHYAERDITAAPAGYDSWFPVGVSGHGDALGQGFKCDSTTCSIDLLELDSSGKFSIIAHDFAVNETNEHGEAGGCVVDAQGFGQAAIVHANGHVELFPRLPGEVSSCIIQLSDADTALAFSQDASFASTQYVLRSGKTYPVSLTNASISDINDQGELAGITSTQSGQRAFRFDAQAQALTILDPVSGDPNSWGLAINHQGEVLGYSFVFSGVERIGSWSRKNQFAAAFVEGTPDFPTVSNQLVWNENGVIVVSYTTDTNTYVIPHPGVRLNLADLVDSGSAPPSLFAYDINDHGDFLAQSFEDGSVHLFVLE